MLVLEIAGRSRVRGDDGYVGQTDIQVFQLRSPLPFGQASDSGS